MVERIGLNTNHQPAGQRTARHAKGQIMTFREAVLAAEAARHADIEQQIAETKAQRYRAAEIVARHLADEFYITFGFEVTPFVAENEWPQEPIPAVKLPIEITTYITKNASGWRVVDNHNHAWKIDMESDGMKTLADFHDLV